MSHSLELPDEIYRALQEASAAHGSTPVQWIANQLKQETTTSVTATLAERFAGRTGGIASGGSEALSTDCGAKFADYLEEKRKAGRL